MSEERQDTQRAEPYRTPEVPASVEAARRLELRTTEIAAKSASERARAARRARVLRRAVITFAVLAAVYTVAALVVCVIARYDSYLLPIDEAWRDALAISLLVSAIATPMSIVFAVGMKVPPGGDSMSGPGGVPPGGV